MFSALATGAPTEVKPAFSLGLRRRRFPGGLAGGPARESEARQGSSLAGFAWKGKEAAQEAIAAHWPLARLGEEARATIAFRPRQVHLENFNGGHRRLRRAASRVGGRPAASASPFCRGGGGGGQGQVGEAGKEQLEAKDLGGLSSRPSSLRLLRLPPHPVPGAGFHLAQVFDPDSKPQGGGGGRPGGAVPIR